MQPPPLRACLEKVRKTNNDKWILLLSVKLQFKHVYIIFKNKSYLNYCILILIPYKFVSHDKQKLDKAWHTYQVNLNSIQFHLMSVASFCLSYETNLQWIKIQMQ